MLTLNPAVIKNARRMFQKAAATSSALVLTGPQACGKTTLARLLAAENGPFEEAMAWQITKKREISNILQSEPRTVIVEDMNPLDITLAFDGRLAILKELITPNRTTIQLKAKEQAQEVRTPTYIFCSGEATSFSQETGDRRFWVLRMGATT
jgi:energy-coupling factor transporter ATP-binding protein EcfA2